MRREVTFDSQGQQCAGWLYLPDGLASGARAPAIVMANAITAVREIVLPAYAEKFAAAGFIALAFDYRFFGASGGEPRGHLVAAHQIEDIRNAISWLSLQPEVDADRIGAWGASFGAAHILFLAAFDRRIKAAVATVPTMRTSDIMVRFIGREGLDGVLHFLAGDRTARYQSGLPTFMPAVSDGPGLAMLPNPEAYAFYMRMSQTIAPNWRNQVTVESMEKLVEYDPTSAIELIAPTPLLMIVGENDQSQPPNLSLDAFARAGEPKMLVTVPAGHTELLELEGPVAAAAAAAIDWYRRYLVDDPVLPPQGESVMSVDANKDLIRRYFDTIWNKGQLQREQEFVAQDVVVHAPPIPGIPEGIGGPLTIVGTFRAAMPDIHLTQDILFGDDDRVVQIWTTRGIHSGGDLFGFPATGKEYVLTGINVFRVANGRIAERWGTMDLMGLMQQLGVAPATPDDLLDLRKGWYF